MILKRQVLLIGVAKGAIRILLIKTVLKSPFLAIFGADAKPYQEREVKRKIQDSQI
jgi:hypothetical protein